ncbi:ATP-dependent endonuclease [Candidatus Atribacteria bacterium HGW-Atribacteria-1]|nr:MAG: ATP-dependent endonuclease [Candidatus Atribacteria bacterium HGW-Atribacteria-1]
MQIKQIKIENFRLLHDFTIDLEEDLSLVIGKNNTGKTSLLSLLERFLRGNQNNFTFHDFNIPFQKEIEKAVKGSIEKDDFTDLGISLKMYIEYFEDDSLENISDLILNLEPKENFLILSFGYSLNYERYTRLKEDYLKFKAKFKKKTVLDYLIKNHRQYFEISRSVVEYNNETNSIKIKDEQISKIITLKTISAKRDVANEEGESARSNKTLSKLCCIFFNSLNKTDSADIAELQKNLFETDDKLNITYEKTFEKIIEVVKRFSYNKNESQIAIKSNLEEVNILRGNTSVVYNQSEQELPEDYNGLGYMNLFAMIFNLHIIFDSFKKEHNPTEKPSDINLLFIEEPEAHTHPQMQYVFIKNIKRLLSEGKKDLNNLQTIISTHSAHITSQSSFNDIKYFYKESVNNVISKNLSELENRYGTEDEEKRNFQFLKRYLTLNKSELFFAEKIIFIEGNTERILLPYMMKKIDSENSEVENYNLLLSQNISIVEVGAYAHVFDNFLTFLGIKTLIITDLDSVKSDEKGNKCKVSEGTHTSNASIKYFLKDVGFNKLKNLLHKSKILSKNDNNWKENEDGLICIAYQTEQNGYHARSFEDAFISLNLEFIKSKKEKFESLKKEEMLDKSTPDYYDIANTCIIKKTLFATDILYYSSEKFTEWQVPEYIKEGLLWLSK